MAVVTDNFNRADGSLGANWVSPVTANTAANGTMKIASNQAGAVTDDKHSFGVWASGTFTDDQYVQIKVATIGAWVGATLRCEQTDNVIYYGFVFTANDYRLYQYKSGVHTQLVAGTTLTWVANDIMRLEIAGSVHPFSLRMYRNGSSALAWTSPDSTYEKTGGRPGIGIYSPAGLNLRIDDWEAGNLIKVRVTDSFNRADGALGANWNTSMAESTGNMVIASNKAGVAVEPGACMAYWATGSFNDNQYSQFRVTGFGANWSGCIVRADAAQNKCYLAIILSTSNAQIFAAWNGTFTQLASLGGAGFFSVGDIFRFEVSGSAHPFTLTLYQNGRSILSWTSPDSTFVRTGGNPGIAINSAVGIHLTVDDFEGGNIDGTADVVVPPVPIGLTSASFGMLGQYQKHFA